MLMPSSAMRSASTSGRERRIIDASFSRNFIIRAGLYAFQINGRTSTGSIDEQHRPVAIEHLLSAEIDFFSVGVGAAKKKHRRPFSGLRLCRIAEVTVVLFVSRA